MFLSENFISFLKENFKAWTDEAQLSKLYKDSLILDQKWCAPILRMAAYKNRLDIIQELFSYTDHKKINRDEYINVQDKFGNTAIFIAASMGHSKVFLYLLEMNACIYRPNQKSHTPLSIAYKKEQKEILENFFQFHTISYYNDCGRSILETALKNKEMDFAKFLVAKGLDIHQPLKCPEKSYWSVNHVPHDKDDLTPLMRAIMSKNFELATQLIELGANVTIMSLGNLVAPFNFLIDEISRASENKVSQLLLLLNRVLSAEGFAFIEIPSFGEHDFMMALKEILKEELYKKTTFLYDMFPLILSKCRDINAPDSQGLSPLELALKFGSLKLVNDLIANGANLYSVFDNIPEQWRAKLFEHYQSDAKAYQEFLVNDSYRHDPHEVVPMVEYRGRLKEVQHSFNQCIERFERLIPTITEATEKLQNTLSATLNAMTSFPQPLSNMIMTYAYSTHLMSQKNWKQQLDMGQQNFVNHRKELRDNPDGHDVSAYYHLAFPMLLRPSWL